MKFFQRPGLRTKPNFKNYNNNYFPPYNNPRNLPIIYPGKPVERRSIVPKSGGFNIQRTIYNMKMQNLPQYINKAKKYYKQGEKVYREVKPYWDKYAPKSWKKKVGTGLALYTGKAKKRLNATELTSISGEITKSNYTCGEKNPAWYRNLYKEAQKFTFNNLAAAQTSSQVGDQFISEYQYLQAQFVAQFGNNIVAQYPTATIPALTAKFGIRNCRSILTFSNSGNNNMIFEIYEIDLRIDQIAKDTSGQLPLFGVINCLSNTWGFQKPLSTTTSLTNTDYQTTPFMNAAFNQCYKVAKIQKVTLAPGSSHEHTSDYNVNQTFNNILTQTYTTGGYRGLTKIILVVQYGLPVHSSGTTGRVDVGPTRLDVVQSWEVNCNDYVQATTITKYLNTITDFDDLEQVVVNNPTDVASDITG